LPLRLKGKEATAVAQGSPTVRRRELGTLLRALRNEKGLTVDQVAEQLLCSPSKVSRMETGHRGATPRDVRDLCELYGVTDEAQRDRLMTLAREGKQQGWWQSYDLPWSTYVGLEAEAAEIKEYKSSVVPGLLQTADYARALHEAVMPAIEADVIEQRVESRLRRQELLRQSDPPKLWAVIDEAVLHRVVGGREIMREQLIQLADSSRRSNVIVQVLPYELGAHAALESNFNILEFTDNEPPGFIYVEGLVGFVYLEKSQDLDRYRQVFEVLCTTALSPKDSRNLIRKTGDSIDLKSCVRAASATRHFANSTRSSECALRR
jgi:transcriptional regulator with XRE-family HTH domain